MEAIVMVRLRALRWTQMVSERGSGENYFHMFVTERCQTAPLGNSVLPGITAIRFMQIARELGIPVVELDLIRPPTRPPSWPEQML